MFVIKRLSGLILCLFIITQMHGQDHNEEFKGLITTNDELVWNGKSYYMNISPLATFNGYKEAFPLLPNDAKVTVFYDFSGPGKIPLARDKIYSVIWKIVDSILYVSELSFEPTLGLIEGIEAYYPDGSQNAVFENFVHRKFNKKSKASDVSPKSPNGVIAATWVNGDYYIKRYPPNWRDVSYLDWLKWPVTRLSFTKGKLTGTKQMKGEMRTTPMH